MNLFLPKRENIPLYEHLIHSATQTSVNVLTKPLYTLSLLSLYIESVLNFVSANICIVQNTYKFDILGGKMSVATDEKLCATPTKNNIEYFCGQTMARKIFCDYGA